MKPSSSASARQSWLACLVIMITTISVNYKIHSVGSTILAPKARICFNSMSSTFQSECVYCDSRLYASTITACTGQPMLANNVTQAQAFCIATACLQVPVLTRGDPFKSVAGEMFDYDFPLRRPGSLKFRPNHAPLSTLLFRPKLMQQKRYNYPRWDSASPSSGYYEHRRYARSLAVPRVKRTGGSGNDTNTTTTTTTTEPSSQPEAATTMASAESQLVEWPNFNQMYSQIYNSMAASQSKPLAWRPVQTIQADNNWAHAWQLRAANLMRSISGGWAVVKLAASPLGGWLPAAGSGARQSNNRLLPNSGQLRRRLWRPLQGGPQGLYSMAQTGKTPTVLGRRRKKRSLSLKPLGLNLNKNKTNGTLTAQLNKSVNGTTVGNVAFVLNKPGSAYIWNNPLTRVLTRNNPNKSLQWQFGRGVAATATAAPVAAAAPARPAPAGQLANPQPSRQVPVRQQPAPNQAFELQQQQQQPQSQYAPEMVLARPSNQLASGSSGGLMTSSYVVPAGGRQQN